MRTTASKMPLRVLYLMLLCNAGCSCVSCLYLYMGETDTKCFIQDIADNVKVVGEHIARHTFVVFIFRRKIYSKICQMKFIFQVCRHGALLWVQLYVCLRHSVVHLLLPKENEYVGMYVFRFDLQSFIVVSLFLIIV